MSAKTQSLNAYCKRKKEVVKRLSCFIFGLLLLATGLSLGQESSQKAGFNLPVISSALELNDINFNYYAQDYGYIHLSRTDDVITFTLNDKAEGGIKLNYEEIDELDDDDLTDTYINDYQHTSAGIDIGRRSIEFAFEDANIEEVTNYFVSEFTNMNFTPRNVVTTANTYAFDCGCNVNSDYHVRVTFTQMGSSVFVHISVI
jgi:hypothetical protein